MTKTLDLVRKDELGLCRSYSLVGIVWSPLTMEAQHSLGTFNGVH